MKGLGCNQVTVLEKLASSPQGLTSADIAPLFPGGSPRSWAFNVLSSLADRGLAWRTGGARRCRGAGRPLTVWAVTAAGRDALAPQPARGRGDRGRHQRIRLARQEAVRDAFTAGMGPATPRDVMRGRALAMTAAGCHAGDIALVFAVPVPAVARLLGEGGPQ
jgi:hypothetical protein